ncbi:MAG: T9SS type A sorting domain-containing protein [Chitinophagaceae bacterium]|nr:T9SS type A sorting domain-containing protein [Chitinophagaceae bacterium]
MNPIITLIENKTLRSVITVALMVFGVSANSQISLVCTDPTNTIYGLTNSGEILAINSNTGATAITVKNNSYSGNSASSANGIGYNSFNSRFYYFKRNVGTSPQEFVSFTPATNTVSVLASSTCTDEIHTGCVSFDGTGYYTIDIQGTLHYYNIAANTWTYITSTILDQNGNNVTEIIKTQNAGDMAIDGIGRIWLVTSSNGNWGLYRFAAPMPTTPVAQITVNRIIDPTNVTPTGRSFAGIAFKPDGRIYMSTRADNRLYLLQNNFTLSFIGSLTTTNAGNDLTSCVFPTNVLPVTWKSFDVTVKGSNTITLNWEVAEDHQNKGFYIEHSLNGSDWEDLAFVESRHGNEYIRQYTYSHINNLNNKQYYRIRQVDIDGKTSYSEIKVVTLTNEMQAVSVWPNPATDYLRIASNGNNGSQLVKAQVFDLSGKMIAEKKLNTGANTISISELRTGTYIVRVQDTHGISFNQKFIKQ